MGKLKDAAIELANNGDEAGVAPGAVAGDNDGSVCDPTDDELDAMFGDDDLTGDPFDRPDETAF